MAQKILITGGAGFIGINVAAYFLSKGVKVVILDNFSRKGSSINITWLYSKKDIGAISKRNLEVIKDDIRDYSALKKVISKVDSIIHLAAQTAVITSIEDPREDFEINALGTLNVLEALRSKKRSTPLIFASTNKVYGDLKKYKIVKKASRYEFSKLKSGINEDVSLDYISPYACSKGAADHYVLDYHRMYGLQTVVFRQSCVYGPRQFGVEDQGWVAHFIITAILDKPITIYGDGRQVRDLLYIDDLVLAYEKVMNNITKVSGNVYNIGGGVNNTVSIWKEFQKIISKQINKPIKYSFKPKRLGDQKIYISDVSKAKRDFGWSPKTNIDEGVERLIDWVTINKKLFK